VLKLCYLCGAAPSHPHHHHHQNYEYRVIISPESSSSSSFFLSQPPQLPPVDDAGDPLHVDPVDGPGGVDYMYRRVRAVMARRHSGHDCTCAAHSPAQDVPAAQRRVLAPLVANAAIETVGESFVGRSSRPIPPSLDVPDDTPQLVEGTLPQRLRVSLQPQHARVSSSSSVSSS
jgi:hypothetical protein